MLVAGFVSLCSLGPVHAQQLANNPQLQELMIADQVDRTNSRGKPWNPEVTQRDKQRREAALAMLKNGLIRTATDYFNVALIMQHGETADDFRLAHAMAWTAYSMREDGVPKREAGWLAAASFDRYLQALGKPQWYGTQYKRNPKTNQPGEMFPYDEKALPEEEKKRLLAPIYQ